MRDRTHCSFLLVNRVSTREISPHLRTVQLVLSDRFSAILAHIRPSLALLWMPVSLLCLMLYRNLSSTPPNPSLPACYPGRHTTIPHDPRTVEKSKMLTIRTSPAAVSLNQVPMPESSFLLYVAYLTYPKTGTI